MNNIDYIKFDELLSNDFDKNQRFAIISVIDNMLDSIKREISKVMIVIVAAFVLSTGLILWGMLHLYNAGMMP